MGLQTFPWKKLSRNDHDRSQAIASLFFYPSSLHLFYLPQVRPSLCPPRHCVRPCFDSGSPTMIRNGNDPLERTKTKENGGKKRSVREFGGSLDASERERERDIATTGFILVLHKFLLNGKRMSRRPPSVLCYLPFPPLLPSPSSTIFPSSVRSISSSIFASLRPFVRKCERPRANKLANL